MPVYLPTATIGNEDVLVSVGPAGEIMGWFYPHRDHAQNVYQCMPCVYTGAAGFGSLHWSWGDEFTREQSYLPRTNILVTKLHSQSLALTLEFRDVVPESGAALHRTVRVTSHSSSNVELGIFTFGDWNIDGIRTGNGICYDQENDVLIQRHRSTTAIFGGDMLQMWQCGKAGRNWGNNAIYDMEDGWLNRQDLEIGDVNWAIGRRIALEPGASTSFTVIFVTAANDSEAISLWNRMKNHSHESICEERESLDLKSLEPGLNTLMSVLKGHNGHPAAVIPKHLQEAYERSLLCLPLLCGREGVAVAAPEFDPEFVSCGGYGYFWPRDGAEYLSGLLDAGYPQYAIGCFDWCTRHQDSSGLWHQRYFLNGQAAPNWCLPPHHLQIDQVGAVLWAMGKWTLQGGELSKDHRDMMRKAACYQRSRLTSQGVHASAFDTWETFIGSFTYSNAALWAGFKAAASILNDSEFEDDAKRMKDGVLHHFVHNGALTRGFNEHGQADVTIDSSALGAIEPFGLLDLTNGHELAIAEGTLNTITSQLETDWEGGRAIRRFQGDAYVGGVPACVKTLWMARCCCTVAERLLELGRREDSLELADRAEGYLTTVLKRATCTGLLPELMQGPDQQRFWAAPHGWAMSSYVSALLKLARLRTNLQVLQK